MLAGAEDKENPAIRYLDMVWGLVDVKTKNKIVKVILILIAIALVSIFFFLASTGTICNPVHPSAT